MKMRGEKLLEASQRRVWEALNDTDVLRRAIPGCEVLERMSDTELAATVAVKIGPVNARFKGDVTLSDLDPPNSYTISGKGKAGAPASLPVAPGSRSWRRGIRPGSPTRSTPKSAASPARRTSHRCNRQKARRRALHRPRGRIQ